MKRRTGETFEEYKTRRARINRLTKGYCQGWYIWNSQKDGTVSSAQLLNKSIECEKSMKGFFEGADF